MATTIAVPLGVISMDDAPPQGDLAFLDPCLQFLIPEQVSVQNPGYVFLSA